MAKLIKPSLYDVIGLKWQIVWEQANGAFNKRYHRYRWLIKSFRFLFAASGIFAGTLGDMPWRYSAAVRIMKTFYM